MFPIWTWLTRHQAVVFLLQLPAVASLTCSFEFLQAFYVCYNLILINTLVERSPKYGLSITFTEHTGNTLTTHHKYRDVPMRPLRCARPDFIVVASEHPLRLSR
jgi:hypothetical protein